MNKLKYKFELNDVEIEKAEMFNEHHKHKRANKGATGGHIEYIFTHTSLGDTVQIKCKVCGETLNITDYESW